MSGATNSSISCPPPPIARRARGCRRGGGRQNRPTETREEGRGAKAGEMSGERRSSSVMPGGKHSRKSTIPSDDSMSGPSVARIPRWLGERPQSCIPKTRLTPITQVEVAGVVHLGRAEDHPATVEVQVHRRGRTLGDEGPTTDTGDLAIDALGHRRVGLGECRPTVLRRAAPARSAGGSPRPVNASAMAASPRPRPDGPPVASPRSRRSTDAWHSPSSDTTEPNRTGRLRSGPYVGGRPPFAFHAAMIWDNVVVACSTRPAGVKWKPSTARTTTTPPNPSGIVSE